MSNVDLSLAKAGDLVHFRCGGNAELLELIHAERIIQYCDIWWLSFSGCHFSPYNLSGQHLTYTGQENTPSNKDEPFDIIKVESK